MHESLALVMATAQIAAAIALLNGLITTLGQGKIIAQAIESIARQPEAQSSISSTMFIGLAMAETSGIYGLLIAFLLLFANPFVSQFIEIFGLK